MVAPELPSGTHAVHVLSGVGVLPMRTDRLRLVPAGSKLDHEALVHVTAWPASKACDR